MGNAINSLMKTIICPLPTPKINVLMIGLEWSGKTTILYRLLTGDPVTTIPTITGNVEDIKFKQDVFTIREVGGSSKIRELWHHYYSVKSSL